MKHLLILAACVDGTPERQSVEKIGKFVARHTFGCVL